MPKIVCYPVTSRIHADTFGRALGAEVSDHVVPSDWAFLVGMSPEAGPLVKALKSQGTKVVGYWIGSDSMCALQDYRYRRAIPECDIHLTVHERIQAELSQWGVKSEVCYPCARNPSKGLPKCGEPKVGVYMPEPELYMLKETNDLASENPDLSFVYFGSGELGTLPSNVNNASRLSPEEAGELQNSFSMVLRLCRHDGYPVGGIETKQRNRHIIENFGGYPGFLYAETMEDANVFLRDETLHEGDFGPFPAYYREMGSDEAFKKRVFKAIGVEDDSQGKIAA